MHCNLNSNKPCSKFGSVVVLIFSILLLVSIISRAQDKTGTHDHGAKQKTEASDKHCGEKSTMSCCGGEQKTKVSEVKTDKPWNELCPVLGNKVDSKVKTVTYNNKAYGFCCPGCDSKFEKDPSKYSGNLSEDGKKFVKKSS